jgi:hypothetical protein
MVTPGVAAPAVDGTLSAQIAALLDQANSTTVPSGVLLWFGNTELPDGRTDAPPTLDQPSWQGLALRLIGGVVPPHDSPVLKLVPAARPTAQPGEPVPLVIASVLFHRPTPSAIAAVRRAGIRGGRADLSDELADVIEPAETTVAAVLLADQWQRLVPAHRGRKIRLELDPALLVTNRPGDRLTDIEIDAAGRGFRPLLPGSDFEIDVPAGTETLTIGVRCSTIDGPRTAACTLPISDQPIPPPPDETWTLTPTSGNTGHAYVFRSATGDAMHRPVMIAEGWPGGSSPQMLADAVGQHGFRDRLLAAGHDVVMIGFEQGLDAIQSNAGVVREAIATARRRTGDPLVVGGMSMGGLVSRYALTQMEFDGIDHGAAVYLSIDSPHGRGAYTTVVGQWLVNHFTELSPAFAQLKQLIRSRSNLQFISLIEADGAVGPDPLRVQFFDELRALGNYPSRLVKLAISCGVGTGSDEAPPTAPVLRWHVDGLTDITLLPLPAGESRQVGAGATIGAPSAAPPPLVVSSDVCWEHVPGALDDLNERVLDVFRSLGCTFESSLGVSSSMPTVSALDIDAAVAPTDPIPRPGTGSSPFDDYTWSAGNQRHLQFTPEVVEWMLDRIERHQPAKPDS